MRFEFNSMTCVNVRALGKLVEWVEKQPSAYDNEPLTVFVDSFMDFCAVEYVNRPYEHTSKAHSLMDCITGRYVPCVVPLADFRRKVMLLAGKA